MNYKKIKLKIFEIFLSCLPKSLSKKLIKIKRITKILKPITKRDCPICGYNGFFEWFGNPPRIDAECPKCRSKERQRFLYMILQSKELKDLIPKFPKTLHFAAEDCLKPFLKKFSSTYQTADLFEEADLKIDIESINISSNSYDLVILNHVFEHVDDYKAASEVERILNRRGILIASSPIIKAWEETFELENTFTKIEKEIFYGQGDHLRYYGSDFPDRITKNNKLNLVKTFTASGIDVVTYSLLRGEEIYVFCKLE